MIILIGHTKGGGGKSTTAINFAVELQARGASVIIIEADPSVSTCSNWANDREDAGHPVIPVVRRTGRLRGIIEDCAKRYDYVIVDTAGKDSEEMRAAALLADVMMIPSRPSQADLDETNKLTVQLRTARDFNPKLVPLFYISQGDTHGFSKANEEARQYLEVIGEREDIRTANTVIYERSVYRNVLREGIGVVESDNAKAKAEIRQLVDEVLALNSAS